MDEGSTAEKIKAAREAAGMTQAQLAKKVGTTPQNISQYERGIRKPKFETIRRIAEAVGACPGDLLPSEENFSGMIKTGFSAMVDDVVNAKEHFLRGFKEGQQEKYLLESFELLNAEGKKTAIQRVDELLQIPAYCFYANEIQKIKETEDSSSDPDEK